MRQPRRLIWKLVPAFVLLIVASTAAAALYADSVVRRVFFQRLTRELESKTNVAAALVQPYMADHRRDALQVVCRERAAVSGAHLSVFSPQGVMLADSAGESVAIGFPTTDPEIAHAAAGRVGTDLRYSSVEQGQVMLMARPVLHEGKLIGVVRSSLPTAELDDTRRAVVTRIALGGLVVALAAAGVLMFVFQRHMMRPLRVLHEGATRFAAGDMRQPIEAPATRELAALTDRLNAMSRQMDEKIRTITQQAAERQAVLSGMIEGVIAIDADDRVIMLNAAAAQWLDVDLTKAYGRKSFEIIRNIQLQDMVARAMDTGQPIEEELTMRGQDRKLSIQAQVAPLGADAANGSRAAAQTGAGVVVVLHDVTRLRHLESIRQEFVANVSHELKTPIAAIKAAVETLVDEAIPVAAEEAIDGDGAPRTLSLAQDQRGPHRFLLMISRQADRLNAIVEDLLMLARIEADESDRSLVLSRGAVAPVLRAAVETCQVHADEKHMAIELAVDASLAASINAPLLEQAMVNMLDNAIKYSPAQTRIEVAARRDNGEVVLSVRDQGPGIEKVHLPRVFERFYRTDKARSRQLGGTGLGLAIVKHVALAHGGRVSVDSSQEEGPGRGSTFRIHLPAA